MRILECNSLSVDIGVEQSNDVLEVGLLPADERHLSCCREPFVMRKADGDEVVRMWVGEILVGLVRVVRASKNLD